MATQDPSRPNYRFGLRQTLIASIGALVLIAVGTVAGVSYLASRSIAGKLGSGLIVLGLDRFEQALRDELDAVVYQAQFVSQAITAGRYGFSDRRRLADFAAGSLAATPQVSGVILADDTLNAIELRRQQNGAFRVDIDIRSSPVLKEIAREARKQSGPFWIEPVYGDHEKSSILGLVVPIRYERTHHGFIVVYILTKTLSEFADRLSEPPHRAAFILFGDTDVLAHPVLIHGSPKLTSDNPLLASHELDDPILKDLTEARPFREAGITLPEGSEALVLEKDGKRTYIYKRTLDDYGDEPLVIGSYFTESIFDGVLATLRHQALIGLALLAGGVVTAILLARLLSRPIRRAAAGGAAIQSLDFDRVTALDRSNIREVDELAVSLNAALEGLKSFGRYVPRSLVARLIKEGLAGAGSEERSLSVMFTDIAGFSAMCETMPAKEVADFVNDHLTLVADCIEREGGTIDKYIGDSVMAFWGAPDTLDNTAVPACRAALAIRSAIIADNRTRAAQGLPLVRIRIGVHTGPLVVGDIGAPTRINYTVVGDVVNGGQRLESLGKEVDATAEVIILISRATAELLPADFDVAAQGALKAKGKESELEVYRLS